MKLLGIDFETQDDQTETTRITEIGAVLVDFSQTLEPSQVYTRLKSYQTFCYETDYPPQSQLIVDLTGITDEMLKESGITRRKAFDELFPLVEEADIIVAHNKNFDQKVFEAECRRQARPIPEKRWLCTLTEVPYPAKFTCKKLSHLAWEHDVIVDRALLHRADYDVQIMLYLLAKYDLTSVMTYANEPWVYIQAVFDAPWIDGGVGKAKAQKLGYGWEKAKGDDKSFPKQWVKRVKARHVKEEQDNAEKLALLIRILS